MLSPGKIFSIAFLSVPALAMAAERAQLNLSWVLAQVRANNPEIRAARAEAAMAQSMVSSARSWPDPQIGVEFWDLPRPGFDLGAAGERWLDISQEIPFPATTYLQSEVAVHEVHRKQAAAEKVVQEQLFLAKQAYWDLYTASASLKAVSTTVRALEKLARISERRARLGQVGRMEQLMGPMAGMEKAGLENQMLALAQERRAARGALRRLMAVEGSWEPPDPEAWEAPVDPQAAEMFKAAMLNRPEVAEARHHVLHARAQRSLAASGWMPGAMLQYSLVESASGAQSGMAMAKLNLPFIWFWRQGAEVAAAGKEVEASEAMLRSAYHETAEMLENELGMLRTSAAQLENDRSQALPQAELALKLGVSGYQSGSVGVADALEALKAYLMVNLEALGLQAQIGRSVAGLERLLGASLGAKPSTEMNHAND